METANGYSFGEVNSAILPILLDSVPTLIAYVNKDLVYEYANHAYAEWAGATHQTLIGRKVYEAIGEETFKAINPYIQSALSGALTKFEYVENGKGKRRLLDVCYTPFLAENSVVRGYTVVVNDITEKKKRELEFIDYAENAAIGLHWVNEDGIIIWANKAELEMLGYAKTEYIGHHISEFHADQDTIADILKRLSCKETLKQYEAVLKCKDGSVRYVVMNSNVLWENGKFIHTRCFTSDITEKKLAEQRLKASEAHYQQLLEILPVAVYSCDAEGYVKLYNRAAVELWGREPQVGKDLWCGSWRIYTKDGAHLALENCPMAVALKEARAVLGEELTVERPNGERRFIKPYPTPIYGDDGKVVGAVNVVVDISEQRQAESALRDSEARYRQVVNSLPVAIYTTDASGRILLYNKTAADLWGREPQIGKDLWCGSWKIYKPDGTPLPLDTCPMAIALKEMRPVLGHEIVVERPDGTRRYVAPYPHPLFNDQGKAIGAVNMLIDITDQKAAMNALAESEERFKTVASQVPIVIWMLDENGDVNYVNEAWSQLTGQPSESAYGQGWKEFIHPEDRSAVMEHLLKARAEKKSVGSKCRYFKHASGYIIASASGKPRFDSYGKFIGYIGILQDVTLQENATLKLEQEVKARTHDLLKKNEELRESEERYHRMISEVQDYAIILLSKDGTIENWNIGAEKIKGYKAEEAIGQNFRIFYTEDDLRSNLPGQILRIAEEKGKASYEGWRIRKDGSRFWGHIVLTALHDEEGKVVGFSKVTRDLTERKQAEEVQKADALKLLEKNSELERMNHELASFAYLSSHDLQEPLRKIQTLTSRVLELDGNNFSPKGKDYFDRIEKAASRMRALIEDLLTYSRANTPEPQFGLLDLNKAVDEAKTDLEEQIQVKKARILSSNLPTLSVIPFQFTQLIINMLGNALKFSKPGVPPVIEIDAEVVHSSAIPAGRRVAARQFHHILIKDNGIGFDPSHAHRIFDIFQRLHTRSEYDGTGVGLAICRKIVENHHGIITAEGRVNEGATFHIYLPLGERVN